MRGEQRVFVTCITVRGDREAGGPRAAQCPHRGRLERPRGKETSMNVSTRAASRRAARALARRVLLSTLALPCMLLAAPPPWAPAHGWRAKNDPSYAGYSGRTWSRDYGIQSGHCNREEVGALFGAVAGGAIGAEAGKDGAQAVAIVVGTVIGAAVGAEIGRSMDRADRACTGHALELAEPGRSVTWRNPSSGITYQLTPADRAPSSEGCRKFRLIATGPFGLSEGRATACPGDDGVWALASDARLTRR
jgi:surface antigen